ncbi:hypothetical protein BXZ70DRAFT_1002615 [Cristinia sonorae]|uniref:Cytochrome c oxidase assembly protein COX20, mitochondrial n=1 Tax=Cristinia sonorae TaxID=1940300 RepID=A0A8K0XKG8_9AGAR|nr:hypothetical protein BXZ70DRAFT_1002615 [Cristinia sonorae]
METPSQPKENKPSSPSKPVYHVESTGSYWGDVREAIKKIGDIPCARSSLLSGIASGLGVGVIRGMSTSTFVAANWAVGAFMVISLGTWSMCRTNMENERRRVQQVVEQIPKRFVKPEGESSSKD